MCFGGAGQNSGSPVNMGASSQSGTSSATPPPSGATGADAKFVIPSIEPDKPVKLEAQPKALDEDIRNPQTGLPDSDSQGTTNYALKKKRDQSLVD